MALNLILGNAGSGKTDCLIDHILEEAKKNPDKTYLYLVPEQFTLSTQRQMVMRSENHCIMNVDVLSFERLSYRVFEELNISNLTVLEDIGKILLLRLVALKNEGKMRVLKRKIDRPQYLDEIKSIITEFLQYHITPDDLREFLNKEGESNLSYKLNDLLTLYEGLTEEMEGAYITSEKLLLRLSEVAERSKILKDSVIAFDGYTGFTPIQLIFVEKLMPLCSDMYVTCIMDPKKDPLKITNVQDIYYLSACFIQSLVRLAGKTGVAVNDYIFMEEPEKRRFVNAPGLAFLEKNIFKTRNAVFHGEDSNIYIKECINPKEELETAVNIITEGVRRGKRYEDFAICTGELETYADYAKKIFEDAGIPYFIDRKEPISNHIFVQYIQNLLRVIDEDFSFDSVFAYLKTGFTDMEEEDVLKLENYCISFRIKGYKAFSQEFKYRYDKMAEEELRELNVLRESLLDRLSDLRTLSHTNNTTVRDYTVKLYEIIKNNRSEEKLEEKALSLSDRDPDDIRKKTETEQIYGVFMGLLDKYVSLLGDSEISFKDYALILNAGIEHLKVASIPMSRDYVIIGDIERTRIENISTLIFTGANMGVIPRVSSGSACLTSNDRERLKERDIVLAPSSRERAFIQQFYLYMLMTKPKESLYITYSDSDMSGKALEPAFLIKKLEKMYGKERLYKDTPYLSISREFDFVRVLEKLSSHKELNEEDRACIAYLANESFYKTILEKVTSAPDYGKTYRNLTEDEIAAVYGDSIKGSISSFEAFASCPMKYYLDYGIGLDEIDDGEFNPLKRGTLTHKAMEQYGKLLAGINKTYTDVSDLEREKLIDEAVAEALNSINDAELKESKRKEYLITTIRKVLVRTTEQIKNNALESGFIPSKNECKFKLYNDGDERIPLSNGKSMRFEGKIDRIDTKESGDTITYRVIDYKSSAKELEMSKVYEGLSLQLITYLDGAETVLKAENRDKNIVSDGAYYYPLLNPIIDVASNDVSDSEIADEIKKALLLNGVGPADSKIKEGTNDKSRSYSEDTLNIVKRFVDKKRKEIGDAILSGKIKPEPYCEGGYGINSCQYCAYNSVCGFDMSLRTCKTKRKVKGKADEIIEMMKKETEGEA
jgi:ATP-dependent helicase/nuclease subunit B